MSFLFALLFITTLSNSEFDELSVCSIRNWKFTKEYLYSSRELESLTRRNVYTNMMSRNFITPLEQAGWMFLPLGNETFHIVNTYYEEYFCAIKEHFDIFEQRRKANTISQLNMIKNWWKRTKSVSGVWLRSRKAMIHTRFGMFTLVSHSMRL